MKKVLPALLSMVAGLAGAWGFQPEVPPGVKDAPFAVVKIHWSIHQAMPDPFAPVVGADDSSDVTPADVLWGERPRNGVRSRSTDPTSTQQPLSSENGVVKKSPGFPSTSSAVPKQTNEKAVSAARETFLYEVTLRNLANQSIQAVYWDYVFADPVTKAEVSRMKFISNIKINPGKSKQMDALTGTPPTAGVSVKQLRKRHPLNLNEMVAIVRIDYSNGSVWRPQ